MKKNLFQGVLMFLLVAFSTTTFAQSKSQKEIKELSMSEIIYCGSDDLKFELSFHPFKTVNQKKIKNAKIVDKGIMGDVYIDWADKSKAKSNFQEQNLKTLQELAFIQSNKFQAKLIETPSKEKLNSTLVYAMRENKGCFKRAIQILEEDNPTRTAYIDSVSYYHQYLQGKPSLTEKNKNESNSFGFFRIGATGMGSFYFDPTVKEFGGGGNINLGYSFSGFVLEASQTVTVGPKRKMLGQNTNFNTSVGIGGVLGSRSSMQVIPTIGLSRYAYVNEYGSGRTYFLYGALTLVPASSFVYKYGPGGKKKYRNGPYLRLSVTDAAYQISNDIYHNIVIEFSFGYSLTSRKFSH